MPQRLDASSLPELERLYRTFSAVQADFATALLRRPPRLRVRLSRGQRLPRTGVPGSAVGYGETCSFPLSFLRGTLSAYHELKALTSVHHTCSASVKICIRERAKH